MQHLLSLHGAILVPQLKYKKIAQHFLDTKPNAVHLLESIRVFVKFFNNQDKDLSNSDQNGGEAIS